MNKLLGFALAVLVSFGASGAAQALTVPGPLVDTAWLHQHANQVVILSVRHDVKSFTARAELTRNRKTGKVEVLKVGGHIPGANLVNYGKIRVNREVNGKPVQMIIPLRADFERMMREVGVRNDRPVIIVSKGMRGLDLTMATRLYWQLKYYGEDNLAILDGGTAQWLADLRPVSYRPSHPKYGNWVAGAGRKDLLATTEDVQRALKTGVQLVDDRPLFQYMGVIKKSYVFAKGHIPGAKDDPIALMTNHAKPLKWLPVAELRELATGMGINTHAETITYCNSGHLASGGWFVMHELMGNKKVRLYDGSMNEWTLNHGPTVKMKMQ